MPRSTPRPRPGRRTARGSWAIASRGAPLCLATRNLPPRALRPRQPDHVPPPSWRLLPQRSATRATP
eukprot:1186751-Lingulodinium_polyedra.AAC.1